MEPFFTPMRATFHLKSFAASLGMLAMAGTCTSQEPTAREYQRIIAEFQAQNQAHKRSLVEVHEHGTGLLSGPPPVGPTD